MRLAPLAAALIALLLAPAAHATAPGGDGRIAFAADGEIWTMQADGGGLRNVTRSAEVESDPSWSPDGRIAFVRGYGSVHVMDADGSGQRFLASGRTPAWSPDGRSIVLTEDADQLVVRSPEGLVQRRLGQGWSPAWSPDGRRLAYVRPESYGLSSWEIRTMDADGSDDRPLVAPRFPGYGSLSWSPDGGRLAFVPDRYKGSITGFWTVPSGGGEARPAEGEAYDVAWAPDGARLVVSVARDAPRPPHPAPGITTVDPDGRERRLLQPAASQTEGLDWERVDPPPPSPSSAAGTPTATPPATTTPAPPATEGITPPALVTGAGSGSPVAAPPARRTAPPEASLALRSRSLRALRRGGARVTVRCSGTCRADLRLTTPRRRVLARGTATARGAGRATVRLRLTRAGRRALRGARSARLVLRGTVAGRGGDPRRVLFAVRFT